MKKYLISFTTLIFLLSSSVPVFTYAETPTTDKVAVNIAKLIAAADREIENRIGALNKTAEKISSMKRISTTTKAIVASSTQIEIANLTALKSEIDAGTDEMKLKAEIKSITASHRIYSLIRPQIEILAAADKINIITDRMIIVTNKVEARVNEIKLLGKDTAALEKTLANTRAKLADAKIQAEAAINRMSVIAPDNGDAAIAASNKESLRKSQADIRVGNLDLHVAKSNLEIILKQIRKLSPKNTTATTTL